MKRHGSVWRRYRNEREMGSWSRLKAAWFVLLFRLKLLRLDMRRWWWRLFAPLDVSGIYMGHRPHKSALILDNLGMQIHWDDMEEATRERAAKERGVTVSKATSFGIRHQIGAKRRHDD